MAERRGTLVGVIEIEPDPKEVERVPWVHMLYVVPAVWGCGVAHALMEAAIDIVRAAGRDVVWLSVLDVHTRARRFYEKEGWQLAEPQGSLTKGRFQRLYLRRAVAESAAQRGSEPTDARSGGPTRSRSADPSRQR